MWAHVGHHCFCFSRWGQGHTIRGNGAASEANFVGYNDVVASALTAPSVGGTPEWPWQRWCWGGSRVENGGGWWRHGLCLVWWLFRSLEAFCTQESQSDNSQQAVEVVGCAFADLL